LLFLDCIKYLYQNFYDDKGWLIIKHIKKDVNKALLFLIIAPLILFVWFSTYYDNKLKNITIEYDKSREKLQELTGEVILEKFNETVQLKESFQKDKESLGKKIL